MNGLSLKTGLHSAATVFTSVEPTVQRLVLVGWGAMRMTRCTARWLSDHAPYFSGDPHALQRSPPIGPDSSTGKLLQSGAQSLGGGMYNSASYHKSVLVSRTAAAMSDQSVIHIEW